ncbi:lipoyl domain-containing protein [Nocardioides caldifontis]|uniref:lipoyl domain-containing protein n=1 Tax=Nocardioides caldifontis TaxID=2588938 RepID=UPI0011E0585C|nr:lipoyl domain-containing protein [Nocardioides caldifontis]
MTDIVVPQWGLTTDEATLNTWLKAVGDRVEIGEPIAELETDKTNADLDSPFAGTITELLVEEGADVVPGQVVARLSDE